MATASISRRSASTPVRTEPLETTIALSHLIFPTLSDADRIAILGGTAAKLLHLAA
jgi:hypothetical protein